MSTLGIASLCIGVSFAILVICDRLIRDLCYKHSDKCRAASAALDHFNALADSLIADSNTPDEITQVVVCLSDQVGHPGLARLVLDDLKKSTDDAMYHFVEFIPHDMTEDQSRSLVNLVRAALESSVSTTFCPGQNSITIREVSDHILVALVLNRLDC